MVIEESKRCFFFVQGLVSVPESGGCGISCFLCISAVFFMNYHDLLTTVL